MVEGHVTRSTAGGPFGSGTSELATAHGDTRADARVDPFYACAYDGLPNPSAQPQRAAGAGAEGESIREQIDRQLDQFHNLSNESARSKNFSTNALIHDLFPDNAQGKTESDVLAKLRDANTTMFSHCENGSCVPYFRR